MLTLIKHMKIRLCQLNSTAGALKENYDKMLLALEQSAKAEVALALFPENCLIGYSIEDQPASKLVIEAAEKYVKQLATATKTLNVAMIVNLPSYNNVLIKNGEINDASGLIDAYGIVLKNSPFILGQDQPNLTKRPMIYLNSVGWQDELFFNGGSFILDKQGNLLAKLKDCEEDWIDVDGEFLSSPAIHPVPSELEKLYKVLVLSLRDYMTKTGFEKAVLGLSGGIDSALVATIAADAISGKNVHCVRLPSMFTSEHNMTDAAAIALALGSKLSTISITDAYVNLNGALAELFSGYAPDVTEENLQARIRGVLLMSISNKFKELLLNTGNKSESSVGYATLYGDTCGGFSVLKDIYKTTVYKLARWRNANWSSLFYGSKTLIIPENVFLKMPSAELKYGQKDSDSLPEYEILDKILKALLEANKGFSEIVQMG